MSKTANKFATEVRARAVRIVLDYEANHPSRWAAFASISEKIGCADVPLFRGCLGNLNIGDEWIADLKATMLAASRGQEEQAPAPEPQPGVHGRGGTVVVKSGAAQGSGDM